MPRKLGERIQRDESGFTLIELMIIIVIIGILVAIALPSFLGQTQKGQDGDAKSNARNLVTQIEACFTDTQDYTKCTSPPNTSLPMGTGTGEVSAAATPTSFTVTAVSRAASGGGQHTFVITKTTVTAAYVRTCTPTGAGDCSSSGSW